MEENSENAIYILMQNVVDKLAAIDHKVSQKKDASLEETFKNETIELKDLVEKSFKSQVLFFKQSNQETEKNILNSIENNKIIPSVNNYKEYSLFGNKSQVGANKIVLVLFCLVLLWSSLKYLPSYYLENSLLKKEKEEYQLFYQYELFKQFSDSENITAHKLLKKIKEEDTLFFTKYNYLKKTFNTEMKKRELQEQLNLLEK